MNLITLASQYRFGKQEFHFGTTHWLVSLSLPDQYNLAPSPNEIVATIMSGWFFQVPNSPGLKFRHETPLSADPQSERSLPNHFECNNFLHVHVGLLSKTIPGASEEYYVFLGKAKRYHHAYTQWVFDIAITLL